MAPPPAEEDDAAAIKVAIEEDFDLSLGGDWGMQGKTLLNLGLIEPAELAQEAPEDLEEDRDP